MEKKKRIGTYFRIIVTILGPIIFEIVDQITGSWVDENSNLKIGAGKTITILIGLVYLGLVIFFAVKDIDYVAIIDNNNNEIEKLKKMCGVYSKTTKSLSYLFGFTADKIKVQQSEYNRKNKKIDTKHINITDAATLMCERIYGNIVDLISQKDCRVTVNYYIKYRKEGILYTEMIGHDGYNSNPKNYKKPKLLKIDKDSYYCEKLLNDNNPDMVFLPDEKTVTKTLKLNGKERKYNQYIAMPISRLGSNETVALIEIVVHKDSILWKDPEEAREFITRYCQPFKEYILLIDILTKFYDLINECQGEKTDEENSGVQESKETAGLGKD